MFYFGRISEGKVPMNPGGEPTGVASACWLERARELVPVWWLAPKNARRAAERERERESSFGLSYLYIGRAQNAGQVGLTRNIRVRPFA